VACAGVFLRIGAIFLVCRRDVIRRVAARDGISRETACFLILITGGVAIHRRMRSPLRMPSRSGAQLAASALGVAKKEAIPLLCSNTQAAARGPALFRLATLPLLLFVACHCLAAHACSTPKTFSCLETRLVQCALQRKRTNALWACRRFPRGVSARHRLLLHT